MSRVLWFTLGALAGTAITNRMLQREQRDLLAGQHGVPSGSTVSHQLTALRERMATKIDTRATQLGDAIADWGHDWADALRQVEIETASPPKITSTPPMHRPAPEPSLENPPIPRPGEPSH